MKKRNKSISSHTSHTNHGALHVFASELVQINISAQELSRRGGVATISFDFEYTKAVPDQKMQKK